MPHGVLHQRLDAQERDAHAEYLRIDPQLHLQTVTEPRLLEKEVLLHRAQLLSQRGVATVGPEAVPGELREVEQQLPRSIRVGAHE